jgi:hypothetical protein
MWTEHGYSNEQDRKKLISFLYFSFFLFFVGSKACDATFRNNLCRAVKGEQTLDQLILTEGSGHSHLRDRPTVASNQPVRNIVK